MKQQNSVSVVLPTYNESENILEVLEKLSQALGKQLCEIIVVDDNSPDETWKIVEDLKNPKYKVIRRTEERGLASAIRNGVCEAKGEIIIWMDADLGIPPEIAPQLVEALNMSDVAIGSRYVKGGADPRPFPLPFLSNCLNVYARLLFGSQIRDYTSGVAAVRKNIVSQVLWSDAGFGEYFAEFSYRCIKRKVRIVELPLQYKIRKSGVSKLSGGSIWVVLRYGVQYGVKMIKWRLRMK
ncbi:MAG: glycosyltransferase [Nanoarchaeota archaeon]